MPVTEEEIEKRIQHKKDLYEINAFKKVQNTFIMTSRFNNITLEENELFRKEKWPNGCIYCTPQEVSQRIPPGSKMIVLEMNNDKNEIYAIGLCSNRSFLTKYDVYENENYNRYNYIGKTRIIRSELKPLEEAVVKALDQLCFYGNDHMKRGQGLKAFPIKLLINCKPVLDITIFLENMFKTRFNPLNETTPRT